MKRILCACTALLLLTSAACTSPAAPQETAVPAATQAANTNTPAPSASPAATPEQNKQVAIQGADGKIQYVDADSVQVALDNPSDVCHAGEDIPLNHCPECPQATEGNNTAVCSSISACCPFCPYAIDSPAFSGCQATSMMHEAERQAASKKSEATPAP